MLASSIRRVKIVCTLGPSTNSTEMLTSLIQEGMDIARLNFSHGSHEFHQGVIKKIREASKRAKKPVAIMQDLQGPKLRVGKLQGGMLEVRTGSALLLYPEGSQPSNLSKGRIAVPISAEIAQSVSRDVQKGARILFDDGRIATQVTRTAPPEIAVEVTSGGRLTDNKGMNLPGTPLSLPCLTSKDIEDLRFGISLGVDAIALSFVRSDQDILDLRNKIAKLTKNPPFIVAKIEREEAIENQEAIIEVIDALLIARGDMAVEVGAERVPSIQKRLIQSCNKRGVPIITATQMLESMIISSTPTRAEASDVANAVFDGTDAVMLSGETANGKYPLEAVRTMHQIILEAERSREFYCGPRDILPRAGSIVDSIEFSASRIAHHVGAVAIACVTHSGMAARALARYRPLTPIVAIMDDEQMIRKLAFVWGVRGVLIPKIVATDDLFSILEKVLVANRWAQAEDLVVFTAGTPTLRRGTTNTVKVHRIGATK